MHFLYIKTHMWFKCIKTCLCNASGISLDGRAPILIVFSHELMPLYSASLDLYEIYCCHCWQRFPQQTELLCPPLGVLPSNRGYLVPAFSFVWWGNWLSGRWNDWPKAIKLVSSGHTGCRNPNVVLFEYHTNSEQGQAIPGPCVFLAYSLGMIPVSWVSLVTLFLTLYPKFHSAFRLMYLQHHLWGHPSQADDALTCRRCLQP